MIKRIKKFFITGLSAAVVNLLLMVLFVEVFNFKTYILKNVANILAIFLSIIYNFMVSRLWTWSEIPKKHGKVLLMQFMSFNLANMFTMGLRVIVFALLERVGINYLLNVIIGIILAAVLSFILYDKIVFNEKMDAGQK